MHHLFRSNTLWIHFSCSPTGWAFKTAVLLMVRQSLCVETSRLHLTTRCQSRSAFALLRRSTCILLFSSPGMAAETSNSWLMHQGVKNAHDFHHPVPNRKLPCENTSWQSWYWALQRLRPVHQNHQQCHPRQHRPILSFQETVQSATPRTCFVCRSSLWFVTDLSSTFSTINSSEQSPLSCQLLALQS